ncbi:hypothetical protein R3P38DRAFT_3010358, partial [Favolaschia claudopus]
MLVAQCLCTAPTLASALLLPWCMMVGFAFARPFAAQGENLRLLLSFHISHLSSRISSRLSSPQHTAHFARLSSYFSPLPRPRTLSSPAATVYGCVVAASFFRSCAGLIPRRSDGWWHHRRRSLPCLLSCGRPRWT